ncbi:hypothetical protein Leryth_000795 [Lithospermum erythrorhizon]|nr:hypothetical protein Leryth_000795 [Lithospermum erythrorhizon]
MSLIKIFLILILLCMTIAESTNPAPNTGYLCITDGKKHPQLSSNINITLSKLLAETSKDGFSISSYGSGTNKVFGLAQCRGDISKKDCSICTKAARQRSSNFVQVVMTYEAIKKENIRVWQGKKKLSSVVTLYGLVQCTRDLSPALPQLLGKGTASLTSLRPVADKDEVEDLKDISNAQGAITFGTTTSKEATVFPSLLRRNKRLIYKQIIVLQYVRRPFQVPPSTSPALISWNLFSLLEISVQMSIHFQEHKRSSPDEADQKRLKMFCERSNLQKNSVLELQLSFLLISFFLSSQIEKPTLLSAEDLVLQHERLLYYFHFS